MGATNLELASLSGWSPGVVLAEMATWGDHRWRSWGVEAIWRSRAMKFTSRVLGCRVGASGLQAWEESQRIFRTGCFMLEIVRRGGQEDRWHLAVQADIRWRSEFWPVRNFRRRSICSPQFYVQFLLQPVMEASTINCGYSTHFQTDLKCRSIPCIQ